jgi:hypothetical protein
MLLLLLLLLLLLPLSQHKQSLLPLVVQPDVLRSTS